MKFIPFRQAGILSSLPACPCQGSEGWPWTSETPQQSNSYKGLLPAIGIVLPSYNQGQFLEEAIRSVLLQNYPRLFFAVIDGGSTDNSIDIINKYRNWLSFVRIGPDNGQSAAINEGFDIILSKCHKMPMLLGWLNSDDIYLPGAFTKVAHMHQYKQVDLLYGDSLIMNSNGSKISYHLNPLIKPKFLSRGGMLASHATLWSSLIHQPLDERYSCALDYELWLRLVPNVSRAYIPYPLGVIRVHSDAKSSSLDWQESWLNDAALNGTQYSWLYKHNNITSLDYRLTQSLHRRLSRDRVSRNTSQIINECKRWA